MKYCLFCREAFEDEMRTCPYCGDELADELDDDGADDSGGDDAAGEDLPVGAGGEERRGLLQVVIVSCEEDLRAVVAVLEEKGIYFEIDEADKKEAGAGLVPGRAWRILVGGDEAHDAFMDLVAEIPHIFPAAVRGALGCGKDGEEEAGDAARAAVECIERILSGQAEEASSVELAGAVIRTFASEDGESINRAKYLLARAGEAVGGLLAGIAAESVASGGEGAERVLFHSMQVLEAVCYGDALSGIEELYNSPIAQVRTRAAYAAGRLGFSEAVDGLLDLLEDGDEDVRYEASESIWRLTGLDFEFEPSAAVEEERANVKRLRELWDRSREGARVRGRIGLSELFRGFQ